MTYDPEAAVREFLDTFFENRNLGWDNYHRFLRDTDCAQEMESKLRAALVKAHAAGKREASDYIFEKLREEFSNLADDAPNAPGGTLPA